MIRGPPDAPQAYTALPCSTTIVGVMLLSGRFAGLDSIRLTLNQPERIGFSGIGRKIIHLIIQQNAKLRAPRQSCRM